MSAEQAGSGPAGAGDQPSEEELRAAYEAEIKKLRVEHIVLEQVVSLINLGMRRTGLAPGTEDERDVGQVKLAIDALRALVPLIEQVAGPQAGAIRDALSQLQLAFVKLGGSPAPAPGPAGTPGGPDPGPAAPGHGPAQGPAPPPGAASPPPPGAGSPPPGAGSPPPGAGSPGPPGAAPPTPPGSEEPKPGEPGPAQRSGRLWIPGQ